MKRVSQWLFAMCDTSNSVPYMIKFNRWMTPSICTYQYYDFLQSTSFSYINCIPSSNDLRNESNIFSVDRGFKLSTKQGRKTASMRVEHCCRSFPFFFRLIPWSTEKNIRFISYHLIFIASQDSKHSYKPLLNDGLFLTFNVINIHMTSQ